MTTFNLTINSQPVALEVTELSYLIGITWARDQRNLGQPQTVEVEQVVDGQTVKIEQPNPEFFTTDTAYLNSVLANHGSDLQAVALRAMRSWASLAGQAVPPLPDEEPTAPPPAVVVVTTDSLIEYARQKRDVKLRSGVTVNGMPIGTDAEGRSLLNGARQLATAVPNFVFKWGGKIPLTAAQIDAITLAIGMWVQDVFNAYGDIETAILATPPTITSLAEIDAAAWPSSALTLS